MTQPPIKKGEPQYEIYTGNEARAKFGDGPKGSGWQYKGSQMEDWSDGNERIRRPAKD